MLAGVEVDMCRPPGWRLTHFGLLRQFTLANSSYPSHIV